MQPQQNFSTGWQTNTNNMNTNTNYSNSGWGKPMENTSSYGYGGLW